MESGLDTSITSDCGRKIDSGLDTSMESGLYRKIDSELDKSVDSDRKIDESGSD